MSLAHMYARAYLNDTDLDTDPSTHDGMGGGRTLRLLLTHSPGGI